MFYEIDFAKIRFLVCPENCLTRDGVAQLPNIVGARVALKELETNSYLNGEEGVIIGRDELHDVFKVRLLSSNKVMGLAYGNLTTVGVKQDVFKNIPVAEGVRIRVTIKKVGNINTGKLEYERGSE